MVHARAPGFRFRSGLPNTNAEGIFSKSFDEAEFAALSKKVFAQGWKKGSSQFPKDRQRHLLAAKPAYT
jgi:hypothetical protein